MVQNRVFQQNNFVFIAFLYYNIFSRGWVTIFLLQHPSGPTVLILQSALKLMTDSVEAPEGDKEWSIEKCPGCGQHMLVATWDVPTSWGRFYDFCGCEPDVRTVKYSWKAICPAAGTDFIVVCYSIVTGLPICTILNSIADWYPLEHTFWGGRQ